MLVAMASNLAAMGSNLVATASNLAATASTLLAMASNLAAMGSNLDLCCNGLQNADLVGRTVSDLIVIGRVHRHPAQQPMRHARIWKIVFGTQAIEHWQSSGFVVVWSEDSASELGPNAIATAAPRGGEQGDQ